jgi:peroxiredoxin Q/BCP
VATNGSNKKPTAEKLSEGATISDLDSFGGTVQTHEGVSVSVKELLEKSTSGVVIFTYPRASTPGCEFAFFSFSFLLEVLNVFLRL